MLSANKEEEMKKILSIALCIAMAVTLGLTGCSGGGSNTSDSNASDDSAASDSVASETVANDEITVVLIPKYIGIPYYDRCKKGVDEAARDLGVNVIWDGPTTPDAVAQVKLCENYIAQGVDVLAVDPNDPASMTPVIEKAKAAGIHVMDWDSYVDPGLAEYSVHMIDDTVHAETLFQNMVDRLPDKDNAEYAIITGGLEAANLNLWIEIGREWLSENYPGVKLVADPIGTDEKQEVAVSKAKDLIKTYPDLDAILCFSANIPPAVGQVIQELGLQGKIVVLGTGMPVSNGPYLEDGSLAMVQFWDPMTLGYLSVWVAQQLALENRLEPNMETPVPGVPVLDLREDGVTIIMAPPTEFNKDNYKNYDF
jgi:simple sugar transport system substrate-binding protein/rhamnose transport system substrate-binding protein